MAKRTQRKDVGAWLGGNRGTVQSRFPSGASDREAQVDAGGGQMEQVRAELGLGAYAAGVGAAGAIGAGVAAVKSGAAARVYNKATNKVVGIHGSPTKGLKEIKAIGPTEHAWAGNPLVGVKKATNIAEEYATNKKGSGSLYVVKASKKDLAAQSTNLAKSPTFGSPQSLKVVREVNVLDMNKNKQIEKALKRAGFKVPKKK